MDKLPVEILKKITWDIRPTDILMLRTNKYIRDFVRGWNLYWYHQYHMKTNHKYGVINTHVAKPSLECFYKYKRQIIWSHLFHEGLTTHLIYNDNDYTVLRTLAVRHWSLIDRHFPCQTRKHWMTKRVEYNSELDLNITQLGIFTYNQTISYLNKYMFDEYKKKKKILDDFETDYDPDHTLISIYAKLEDLKTLAIPLLRKCEILENYEYYKQLPNVFSKKSEKTYK